jgi:hypothetical protein
VNVNDQFQNSCIAMGALSALVATGFGTAFFDGLKLRREMAARPRNEDNK